MAYFCITFLVLRFVGSCPDSVQHSPAQLSPAGGGKHEAIPPYEVKFGLHGEAMEWR